ncbi:hypothetical protein GDO86_004530 [Hymenochirus boettgeri]|uniref:Uncharacterized protein n=1 Tax=Hymenochirus boettgeri TaxID=247094 RepID=A0A8T2KDU6_9PIPI|nr:hypothetical protein GDO86_004530 [Hymenochirus boettgeri]
MLTNSTGICHIGGIHYPDRPPILDSHSSAIHGVIVSAQSKMETLCPYQVANSGNSSYCDLFDPYIWLLFLSRCMTTFSTSGNLSSI